MPSERFMQKHYGASGYVKPEAIAPAAEDDSIEALKTIQYALSGKVVNGVAPWRPMRNYLKNLDIYEGDLQGEAVMLEVVNTALARAEEYRKGAK